MKTAILACLMVAILAVDVQNSVWSRHDQQILAQIQESKWASFILNFSELNLQTNGALTDLLTAIEQLLVELNEELELVHHNYARRTDVHNRDVTRLEQEIQDTEREIFNAHDLIDNVIIPRGERFANQLQQLQENIANNRKSLEEETFQRNKAHDEFEERVAENNEAISAIDECLQLLSYLNNPSLVQIQKVQSNLAKLHKKLQKHSVFAPLIRALIEMATDANFADQGALKQIVSAFGELRNALVDQLNQETADEAVAQKDFVARVAQLNKEHSEFLRAVQLKTAEIDANSIKHEQTEQYLDDKNADLASLNGLLQAENDDFAAATDLYNNLVAEYTKEIKASNDAYALLTQPSFTEYVKSRGIL